MERDTCGCDEIRTLTRRGLIGRGLVAGAAAGLTGLVGEGLSTNLAFAAESYTGDTLVVLSLRGGFDGLSAIAPIGDPDYYRARPTIALPKSQVIDGDGAFGLHPALAPLLPMWKGGNLAAVHAVGQPNPTRSHFAAMEEMENAAAGTSLRTGWLDRMLGMTGANGPLAGVSMGNAMPARLFGGPARDVSMASVDDFTLAGESSRRPMAAALRRMYASAPPLLAAPAQAADAALTAAAPVRATPYTPANGAVYPVTPLGKALRDVARLIRSGVGLAAAAVDSGDWDMHEGLGTAVKGQRMYDNLYDVSLALAAFAADLGPDGMAKVTLVTVSEFGRRVQENGSRGVDHGHGNAMLLMGGGVRGGKVYGRWPSLAPGALVDGDLAATTDYRAVIGEILQQRCGFGSLADVFPSITPSSFGLAAAR
jgi:uncharacterized protein (DUF1501 family)